MLMDHAVLSALRILPPYGKDLGPITLQSATAVTRRILAAPHFTYPKGMKGCINPPALGVEAGPPRMRSGDRNHSATRRRKKKETAKQKIKTIWRNGF
jgi:hypothetical protein